MTTPTGTISLSNVNTELGKAATALITMNDANVRTLAVKTTPGSTISMNDLRGKSSGAPTHAFTFYDANLNAITSINEGSSFQVGLTSLLGSQNYTFYNYTITGVSSADLSNASLTGSIQEDGNYISFTVAADATTEGAETLTITLNSGQGAIATKTLTINDTSTTPAATYSLTRSAASVNEGGSFTITFSTNQAGSFAYTITGVSSADINNASLTGSVTNGSVLSYSVTADSTTEGTETFTIALNNGLASTSVTLNDTSISGGGGGGGAIGTPVSPTTYNGQTHTHLSYDGYASVTLQYSTDGVYTITNADSTLLQADLYVTPQTANLGSGYWVKFTAGSPSSQGAGSANWTGTTGWLQLNQARLVIVEMFSNNFFGFDSIQVPYTIELSTSSGGSPIVSTNTVTLLAQATNGQ